MKKVFYLLIVLSVCSYLQANSVASADDFSAPLFNSAALSFGNSEGLAFIGYYDEDGITNDHRFLFNTDNLSFVYGKISNHNEYKLSLSQNIARNIYFGTDVDWVNKHIKDADYSASLLMRPTNIISLGLNAKQLNRSKPIYVTGIAIKPPFWSKSDNFILTAEMDYSVDNTNNKYEVNNKRIGVETNLLNGVKLAGKYDIENETFGLNISLYSRTQRIGSFIDFDKNNELDRGAYYINISTKEYPQLFLRKRYRRIQKLKLNTEIVDEKEQMKFGPFVIVKNQQTLSELTSHINSLKDDERVSAIILKNPKLPTNYANLQELQRTFNNFRATGKKIYVYADNYGNVHYAFLAAIADKLFLNPNGVVALQGFSINAPYFSKALDKLGIDIYDLKSHNYKTAFNIFTESEMTSYERETYEELLEVYFREMVSMIQYGRLGRIENDIAEVINQGPYFNSLEAKTIGLIDELIYEDQVEEIISRNYEYVKVTDAPLNARITTEWYQEKTKSVAVIYAVGNITTGDGTPGKNIGSKTLSKQIRKARKDDSIKGIIIRVNSGGGSAFASDVIDREVKLCREIKKPVIVSMGGSAASGGYYIAANADKIIAEHTTVTGSIGVTGLIPNFTRMFEKLYINWNGVKKGDNADLLSPYRKVEEEDLAILKNYIDDSYQKFVSAVADGRNKDYNDIHNIAQGRVWSGYNALELGLIDEIGGMDRAVELMKEKLKYENIRLIDFSYTYNRIPINLSGDNVISGIIKSRIPKNIQILNEYKEYFESFGEENIQYIIRPFEVNGLE